MRRTNDLFRIRRKECETCRRHWVYVNQKKQHPRRRHRRRKRDAFRFKTSFFKWKKHHRRSSPGDVRRAVPGRNVQPLPLLLCRRSERPFPAG